MNQNSNIHEIVLNLLYGAGKEVDQVAQNNRQKNKKKCSLCSL